MEISYVLGEKIKISRQTSTLNGYTWNYNGGIWDKGTVELFASLIREDSVVIDVGAQSGLFTLLAKFFPLAEWHSFEPAPVNRKLLEENLSLNKIQNVTVYPVALGEENGEVTLHICPQHLGLNTIGTNVTRFQNGEDVRVPLNRLDDLWKEKKLHLMKIDTEGAELDILRGGKETILREQPLILLEYNGTNLSQCGHTLEELDRFVEEELGYEFVFRSSDDALIKPRDLITASVFGQ